MGSFNAARLRADAMYSMRGLMLVDVHSIACVGGRSVVLLPHDVYNCLSRSSI